MKDVSAADLITKEYGDRLWDECQAKAFGPASGMRICLLRTIGPLIEEIAKLRVQVDMLNGGRK